MKLRILGNSIRLRLTKSEVVQFGETGKVEDMVEFGAVSPGLCYRLSTTVDDDTPRARFEDHCLSISVPAGEAENWIGSEQIGIEATQLVGDRKFLRIMVEKDFTCLEGRTAEDDSDAFPNRLAARCK